MNKSNASAQVSKLVAIEERLAQLHSFNDEAFAEVISLLTEGKANQNG